MYNLFFKKETFEKIKIMRLHMFFSTFTGFRTIKSQQIPTNFLIITELQVLRI